jgi:retron-type reverse transcriptase
MFASIVEWDNLWLAYRKAAKGKRSTASVARFEFQVADRLVELQDELTAKTYRPGPYTHFTIHEPKRRKTLAPALRSGASAGVSAAPFRDRVVHHALCNVIEPLFEERFIADSYANRVGKGTHKAIDRLQHFSRRYRYVLRMDVVQHFPSLDHAILRQAIAEVIHDEDVLWLVDLILASGAGVLAGEYDMVYFPGDDLLAINRPRGLPIGNLTSQFWSNVYMTGLDRFVKKTLKCPAYLRYVDDFAQFSDSKKQLWEWKRAVIDYLATQRLTVHETAAQVQPVATGIPWLGFVVYPTHRLLKRRNAVNFTRRLRHNIDLYHAGRITFAELDASVQGWINHVRFADTWGLRSAVLRSATLAASPIGASGRKGAASESRLGE